MNVLPMLIGGAPVESSSWVERENPARPEEIVGRAYATDAAGAAGAVEAAHAAFAGWAGTPFEERAAAIGAACDAVEPFLDALARLLCRELGKPLADARAEVSFSLTVMRDALARARRLLAETAVNDELGRMIVAREPYGVVAAITPWNAPIVLAALKVGPAAATGNPIVLKPSPVAPLAVTRFFSLIAERLPAGVINIVHGEADVGEVLCTHPHVRKIAFTGGVATGRAVAAAAGARAIPLVLELGGNDAAIFLDDADLSPAALERAVFATFLTAGQVCMAAKRLYVHASRAQEFLEGYRKVADEALVIGDPLEPSTTLGPVATARAREVTLALREAAVAAGGEASDLGRVADEALFARGYFVRPAIVTGCADDDPLVAEEQFGPIVPLLTFEDDDKVVARANAVEHGLASSVWSADVERAIALARRLEAGTTFINTHNRSGMALRAPFGGRKASGYGREYADEGVLEYVQTHAINLPAGVRDGGTDARGYPT